MKATFPPIITRPFFETKCRRKGLVLDTNILNLYIIGCAKHGELKKNTPLVEKYDKNDFMLLEALIKISKNGSSLHISPQTIPEALFGLGIEPRRKKKTTRQLPAGKISNLSTLAMSIIREANEDIYFSTPNLIKNAEEGSIEEFGIPDISFIPGIKSNDYAFLSDDSDLVSYMYSLGICAMTWREFKSF